jgi:hypothetical protein
LIYGAYFDESDEKPGFAIAGYSAAYDTWWHLGLKWQELLDKWNLKYFKASECENGLQEFAQFRDDPTDQRSPLKQNERAKLKEIKTQFIDVICKHHDDLQGYGAAIVTEDFERIIAQDPIARKTFLDKPYYLGLQLCLVAAAMPVRDANMRRSGDAKIELRAVFDSHEKYSGLAKKIFDDFSKKNPRASEVLLPLVYDQDVSTIPLQVADTLAYEIRKRLTRTIRAPDDEYMRVPLVRLRPAIYRIYKLNYESLKTIAAHQLPDKIAVPHLMPEELL